MNKQEFLDLCNKWYDSCRFCKGGKKSIEAKKSYNKIKEECEINHKDALQYIRESLMETPNYMVKLLDDFYKEEYDFSNFNDHSTIDKHCTLWLNITDPKFDGKHLRDYYKAWREWRKHLKENYISWNMNEEKDPNVTFQEFKQGKRNKHNKTMTWEELIQKINDYNNTATICFNKNTLNIETLKILGNTPEESYKRIVSILVGEYITHEYIPQYARWEDNPIKVMVETKILNEFHDFVEYVLDSLDNDYDKILDIIKNK